MAIFRCVKHTVMEGIVYRPGQQMECTEIFAENVSKHFERIDAARAPAVAEPVEHDPTDGEPVPKQEPGPDEAEDPEAAPVEDQSDKISAAVDELWPKARRRGDTKAMLRSRLEEQGIDAVWAEFAKE